MRLSFGTGCDCEAPHHRSLLDLKRSGEQRSPRIVVCRWGTGQVSEAGQVFTLNALMKRTQSALFGLPLPVESLRVSDFP